jgi:hypothetical protein
MPALQAVDTVRSWSSSEADVMRFVASFALQAKALRRGDLENAERMLMAQASTLDVIFNELARRAAANLGQSLTVCDAYLRLALKAQSQCRATLETLSLVKNPRPVSFVRQANIANGPQQVNNGPPQTAPAAKGTDFPQIKLLEQQHGKRLDARTAQAAGVDDSAVATVATVHRTADSRGQGAISAQRLQRRCP